MSGMKKETNESIMFDSIRIGLASPEKILEWSHGEVTKPETINYRTLKPEHDGLFCQKIFGPTKDWECFCGKYKKIKNKGTICDKCGVEVTKANVRRERMGHIKLAAPVSHIWYFKGVPSRISFILNIPVKSLEKVLYFSAYVVLDKGETDLEYMQVLTENDYQDAKEKYGYGTFRVGSGAEAIKELLQNVDLDKDYEELKEAISDPQTKGQKRSKLLKRLGVVDAFRTSHNKPEWMILDVIPVIPPDLRPMVQLDGGRFATSDLNDLYRRIINRNNRLAKLLELGAPDIIVRNEKRMLQEAVDSLFDNGRHGRSVTGAGSRVLKSFSDMLKGKTGRFRQNLLGKRVDYSGRSVIVVGPELKIYQCGLPKEMALELFKPFVMKEIVKRKITDNIKGAKKLVDKFDDKVWDVLEEVISEHPVMLNRAPTLHRLGIQAFEPILVEGKAIKLHPLVCTAFNADFDGDQMAVHLPLSVEAQAECRFLLLSPNNLLKPSDGAPVAVPSQDMVLGIYYLTQERDNETDAVKETAIDEKGNEISQYKSFKDLNEAIMAYENGVLGLHARIRVRVKKTLPEGREIEGFVESTLGRFLFNEILPQDLGEIERETDEDKLKLEVNYLVGKKQLKKILEKVINTHGATKTAEVLDLVKAIGYKFSTKAAMTVSIKDMVVPSCKQALLDEAQAKVDTITRNYNRGMCTDEERYKNVIQVWNDTDERLTKELMASMDDFNNIKMMADSGARGSEQQMKQLAAMRGLMSDTTGHTIELPIKSNFREGLDVLEYFMSAHGARKGLSDTALRTADSGYLTRRMVDVCQELIIRETDCAIDRAEIPGITAMALVDGKDTIENLETRIKGRFAAETIMDDKGEVIVKANHMITPSRASRICAHGVDAQGNPVKTVKIRSILTCKSRNGICAKCYGANMSTGEPVQVGEAVGIIAAQSIGEPGTQLTMRTFHTGGIAGNNITQGLPRVEELFEARKPKGLAIISEIAGKVTINETKQKREVVVDDGTNTKTYSIPYGSRIRVEEGQSIEAGDELTEGSIYPADLLEIKKIEAVENYLIREVQKVYNLQGVDLADKHIEVIVRQMLKKQLVEEAGDTDLLPGSLVDRLELEAINEELLKKNPNATPAEPKDIILGITKAALATNSFLSAASFQETTRVLTDAATKGKVDTLIGLKENVLIGRLIPAGTGMKDHRDVKIDTILPEYDEEEVLDEEVTGEEETVAAEDGQE